MVGGSIKLSNYSTYRDARVQYAKEYQSKETRDE